MRGRNKMNEEDIFNKQVELEKNKTDIAFLQNAPGKDNESIMSKHLQANELLEQIEKLLMGYQLNNDTEEYEPVTIQQDDGQGGIILLEQGPIMDPNYVRMTIGYLRTFLNSNVYLSYIESMDQVNNMMWDIKKKLTTLLHPLKNRYDSKMIDVIGSMVEYSIYMSLLRAYKKISLDAMSKMQHSIEHLNPSGQQGQQAQQQKKFKIFGF